MIRSLSRHDLFMWHLLYAEDGGDGNGGAGGADGGAGADEGEPQGDAKGDVFDPSTKLQNKPKSKYFTQFPKKYQTEYKDDDFTGIENVEDLYTAYRGLKAQQKDALVIPTDKSTPDEIKGFFEKIGMPKEGPGGYDTPNFEGDSAPYFDTLAPLFRDAAYSCGLTKGQALRMWANLSASVQSFINVAKDQAETLKGNFDTRYSDFLEKDIPDATRRSARIAEEKNAAHAFGEATGLTSFFDQTGLSYNPEFTHRLADWYRKIKPMAVFSSDTGQGKVDNGLRGMYRS